MRDRLRRLAVVVLVGSVASGCVSADEPSTLPDTTPSMTLSPTATTTSPPPDADPTAALEAEITAFFEEYIDTVNESWTSEEALARNETMFSASCTSCTYVFGLAQRAHAEDLIYKGELGRLDDVRLDSFSDDVAVVSVMTSSDAAQLVNSGGEVIARFSETDNLQVIYQAARTETGWVIIKDEVIS